jgi:SAM-dependent methyltransferase
MLFSRYDKIVQHYPSMWPLLVPGYVPILNAMLDIVRARSDRPRIVLDLGCGPGSATVAIAPACQADGRVTLVDGSRGMVEAARALLGSHVADAVVGDFTERPVAERAMLPNTYDLVVSSFGLHHIDDQCKRELIEAAARSLRPGGLMLLGDEVISDRPAGWDMVERVRGRIITDHLDAGRITREFWEIETSLTAEERLPFCPTRVDDLVSFMARGGLAVSCPVNIFGSALLVGIKQTTEG